jgi:predicted AAA+ superfamily ATPase
MSLLESSESTGQVSLGAAFDANYSISGTCKHDIQQIVHLICRGGWPDAVLNTKRTQSHKLASHYLDPLVDIDIAQVDGIKRNPARARGVLRSLARHVSTSAPLATILQDIQSNHSVLDVRTVDSYVSAFAKLFVVENTQAWAPRLRSKAVIRTTSTRHFVDPSIATAALGAAPKDLIADLNTCGLLFENLAIRDLKIYTQLLNGDVFAYNDKDGLEVDAIVHLHSGQWGAIEIKLGGMTAIESGVANLFALQRKVDPIMNAASFLMVLVGVGDRAYKRNDGIMVVPLGCLGP